MAYYKHVLVAADLHPEDDHPVINRAKDLADAFKAKLSIIHVIEQPTYAYGTPFISEKFIEWQAEYEEETKKKVAKLAESIGVAAEDVWTPTGNAKSRILEVADEVGADLIIVGSHGRHGLELLLLGSTANAILHHATRDILTVRVNNKKEKE